MEVFFIWGYFLMDFIIMDFFPLITENRPISFDHSCCVGLCGFHRWLATLVGNQRLTMEDFWYDSEKNIYICIFYYIGHLK